jgi:hypothetical protein
MSWQDVRHHYEERDDDPDQPPVELEVRECSWCKKAWRTTTDDASCCCSNECRSLAEDRFQKELDAVYRAMWEDDQKRMVSLTCRECGGEFKDFPEAEAICSRECGWQEAGRLYVNPDLRLGEG